MDTLVGIHEKKREKYMRLFQYWKNVMIELEQHFSSISSRNSQKKSF